MKKNYENIDFKRVQRHLIYSRTKYLIIKMMPKPNEFANKKIEDIMFRKKSCLTVKFYDYLILDEFKEFLKRFYSLEETLNKLPQIISYINSISKLFPNYTEMTVGKYMFKNISCKQNLLDLNYKLEQEEFRGKEFDMIFNNSLLRELNMEQVKLHAKVDSRDYKKEEITNRNNKHNNSFDSVETFINFIDQSETACLIQNNNEKIISNRENPNLMEKAPMFNIILNFVETKKIDNTLNDAKEKFKGIRLYAKKDENKDSSKSLEKVNSSNEKPITFVHYHNLNIKKEKEKKESFYDKESISKKKKSIALEEEYDHEFKNNENSPIEINCEKYMSPDLKLLFKRIESKQSKISPVKHKTAKYELKILDDFRLEEQLFKTREDKTSDLGLFVKAKKQAVEKSITIKANTLLKENEISIINKVSPTLNLFRPIFTRTNLLKSMPNRNSSIMKEENSFIKLNSNHFHRKNINTPNNQFSQTFKNKFLQNEKKTNIFHSNFSNFSYFNDLYRNKPLKIPTPVNENPIKVRKINYKEGKQIIKEESTHLYSMKSSSKSSTTFKLNKKSFHVWEKSSKKETNNY